MKNYKIVILFVILFVFFLKMIINLALYFEPNNKLSSLAATNIKTVLNIKPLDGVRLTEFQRYDKGTFGLTAFYCFKSNLPKEAIVNYYFEKINKLGWELNDKDLAENYYEFVNQQYPYSIFYFKFNENAKEGFYGISISDRKTVEENKKLHYSSFQMQTYYFR